MWHRHATTANTNLIWFKDGLSSGHYLHLGADHSNTQQNQSNVLIGYNDSTITVGNSVSVNGGGPYNTYTAAMWCSVPGLVKVGSYTGNSDAQGVPQTINTGITSALAYFIIKAVNQTGSFHVCASKVDYANDWFHSAGGSNYF